MKGMYEEGYIREGVIPCDHPNRPTADSALAEHGIGCIWQCLCGAQFKLEPASQREPVPYWSRYYVATSYYER